MPLIHHLKLFVTGMLISSNLPLRVSLCYLCYLYTMFMNSWTIDTKYYTADVSIWMAHLDDGFSINALPISNKLAALVMVFDMNDVSLIPLSKFFY